MRCRVVKRVAEWSSVYLGLNVAGCFPRAKLRALRIAPRFPQIAKYRASIKGAQTPACTLRLMKVETQ
eukprot:6192336-Pleurochrysis_carterae.AAC.1